MCLTETDIGCHVLRSGGLERPKAKLFPQAVSLLHGEDHCSPAVPCALTLSVYAVEQLSTLALMCLHYTCQQNTLHTDMFSLYCLINRGTWINYFFYLNRSCFSLLTCVKVLLLRQCRDFRLQRNGIAQQDVLPLRLALLIVVEQ